ncbi:MAG: DeoR/GlpR transcriptional regulator [Clostridia bacterium]|nr:DeoR/GlpR transcriptional regulator [Clostridia bacterium]
MAFKERESAILEYLQEKKEATVGELCRAFFVSEPTMRRDLLALHNAGKILRTHGGAVYRGEPGENLPQGFREREHVSAKALIAKRCLALVKDGDTVMLDASSTAFELLKLLPAKHSIVVLTNNAGAAQALAETKIKAFVTGGELARGTYALVGSQAESFIRSFNADICFFSVRRLTPDGRLTDNAIAENAVRRAMLSRSRRSVLMLDSQKIGEPCMNTLCTLDEVTHVVSEEDISAAFPSAYKEKFL